jgi:molecular chaperone DnaJ
LNLKDALRSLGLIQIQNIDEARKAYRKLALKFHPDHNPGDKIAEERFKELKDAYDFILETYKDEDLEVTDPGVFTKDPNNNTDFGKSTPNKKKQEVPDRPLNLKFVLHLSIFEAAEGCNKTIQYIRQSVQLTNEPVRLSVAVPAGVTDGQKLRVQGEGSRDGKRPAGDLIVHVRIESHPLFIKEGRNVKMDLPIKLSEAIFGCEKSVPTLSGFSKLKIPAGTKSGQIFRLNGKGFPRVQGFGKGDFLIRVLIDLPLELSTEEKFWIQKISEKKSPLVDKYEQILKTM